ncbi:MAG: hypothetical protein ABUL53_05695 [Bradyrhizobium guangdongense]
MIVDANYFIEKADFCIGLSRLAGENRELAKALKLLGDEFMAKAVELDTERDREESLSPGPRPRRCAGS